MTHIVDIIIHVLEYVLRVLEYILFQNVKLDVVMIVGSMMKHIDMLMYVD